MEKVKHKGKQGVQLFVNKDLELEVRAVKNNDGSISLNAEDTARGFGWIRVAASGNEVIRWERVNKYIAELGPYPQVGTNDYIPESLFYLLGMKANNEVAKKFQTWLAVDVLPSIRKHGMYATDELLDNPDLLIAAATKLKEERAARLEAEKKVQVLRPKAEFYDDVAGSKDAISIAEVAKVLAIKGLGRNNLFQLLRDKKILQINNQPYQQFVDRGYFRVVEQKWTTPEGETKINIKTLVYQKGLDYIRKIAKEI